MCERKRENIQEIGKGEGSVDNKMEMNIASAQRALQETDTSLSSSGSNGVTASAGAALAEAKAGLQQSASLKSPLSTSNGASDAAHNKLASSETPRLQLIDEDQKFSPQLGQYLEKWGLEDVGFNYNLCAVVGSQSTGKSTLLNKLFGTTFDVMNENERRQTTKGEL